MTMCIGIAFENAVILGADSRRTLLPSGTYTDDFQKVARIVDNLWVTGAGNVALVTYLQNLLAEFVPRDLEKYLQLLRPMASCVLQLQKTIYANPIVTQTGYEPLAALLLGGYNPATNRMGLFGFTSANDFIAQERRSGIVGGTDEEQDIARFIMAEVGIEDPKSVPTAIQKAICAVSQRNREIGPHGHVITISREGYTLRQF